MRINSVKQDPKMLFLLVPFILVVYVLAKIQEISPVDISAHGQVTEINWNDANHGLPYLLIKEYDDGRSVRLESPEIILSSSQIQLGDEFKKESGSKFCEINSVRVQCIQ